MAVMQKIRILIFSICFLAYHLSTGPHSFLLFNKLRRMGRYFETQYLRGLITISSNFSRVAFISVVASILTTKSSSSTQTKLMKKEDTAQTSTDVSDATWHQAKLVGLFLIFCPEKKPRGSFIPTGKLRLFPGKCQNWCQTKSSPDFPFHEGWLRQI